MEDKGPQPNRETSTKVVFQSLTEEVSVEKVFSVMSNHVLGLKDLSQFFYHNPDRRHIRMDPHNKRESLADLWLQLKS